MGSARPPYSGAALDGHIEFRNSPTPRLLYQDSSKMQYGPFARWQPPMPSRHDIFKTRRW